MTVEYYYHLNWRHNYYINYLCNCWTSTTFLWVEDHLVDRPPNDIAYDETSQEHCDEKQHFKHLAFNTTEPTRCRRVVHLFVINLKKTMYPNYMSIVIHPDLLCCHIYKCKVTYSHSKKKTKKKHHTNNRRKIKTDFWIY